MENYFEKDFSQSGSPKTASPSSKEATNYFEQDFPLQQRGQEKSAYEEMFPAEAAYEREQSYGPSGATLQQAMMASIPRDPKFQAYAAEKSGLDVQGFDEKGRMMIRNPQTGDISPLTRGFFKDKAATIGTWVKPASQIATMAVADTLGTTVGTPVGGAALASAAAGATDLVFQKIANDYVGEPMSAGHAVGETAGAAAGYATFGAVKWGAEGFGKLVQKSAKHLGSGAKELIQGVTQVKKEPLDWLWKEMEKMPAGGKVKDIIDDKFLSLDIPQKLARKAMYGAEDAEHSLENLVLNYKRNMTSTGGDPKKIEAIQAMYKSNLGPEADNSLLIEMLEKPKNVILDSVATSEDGLSHLSDKVIGNLERAEEIASKKFGGIKRAVLESQGNRPMSMSAIDNEFMAMMKDFGHVETSKFGKAGPDIFAFNETKLSKPAVALYKDLLDNLGYKVGTGLEGKTTIFERPKDIKLGKLWKTIDDFQTRLDKALDPMKGTLSDAEAAPLSSFIGKLRDLRSSVDTRIADINKMWTDISSVKTQFKTAKAQGYAGEKGMINKFKEISANATGKNETFGASITRGLRGELEKLDKYSFMKGRELLPAIDQGVASAKLGNMLRNGSLDEAVNKFSATMQHALPQTGNIQAEAAKEALKAIDSALPTNAKFLYPAQRHLTNIAFNKPGSIYQARWLAFTLASMLGYTHLGPVGILGGIGLAAKLQKPATFAKKVIPFLTGAGKAVGQPSSALHGAGAYLGRQAFAQAGRKAGGEITSS